MNGRPTPPLPAAIARRNPWPSPEGIDALYASGTLPGGAAHLAQRRRIESDPARAAAADERASTSRYTAWSIDQVSVSACALLADDVLDAIAETLTGQTAPMTLIADCGPHAAHPPLAHLWRGIDAIEVHTFAYCRVMAVIRFSRAVGGGIVYADGALVMGGDVPETVRLQALGTEMQGLLPHPVFFAHRWRDQQRETDLLNGPESCLLMGGRPGLRLAQLARADRSCLLLAAEELGLAGGRSPDARTGGDRVGVPDHPGRREDDL